MAIEELTTSSGEMEMKVVINALIKKMEIRVEQIADLTEKVDEMERVWRGEDECVSGDLEDIGKRVEALENDSLMQYEMDKPDPDPPEEETK